MSCHIILLDADERTPKITEQIWTDCRKVLYNIKIHTKQTKYLTVSKESIRCKLKIKGIIEQVMKFPYLGVLTPVIATSNLNKSV